MSSVGASLFFVTALLLGAALPGPAAAARPEAGSEGKNSGLAAAAKAAPAGPEVFAWSSTAPLTLERVLAHFELYDTKLESLSAHFTQSLTMTGTGLTSSIEGTVQYLKPERLRIEHIRPEVQTVVTDGTEIWLHRHSLGQVIQSSLADWKEADPALKNLLHFGSYAKMMRNYQVVLDTAGARPALVLTPKEVSDTSFELRLSLARENLFPDTTELAVGSMRVRTQLDGVVLNPELDENTFHFTPPPGADVFRNFKPPRFER